MSKFEYKKICPTYGEEFRTTSQGRVFCSGACKTKRKSDGKYSGGYGINTKSEAKNKKQTKESFRKVDEFIYKFHKENGRWLSYGKAVEMMEKAGA